MLEIDDKTYILGYWYTSDSVGNFVSMFCIKQNNEWKVQITFSYISTDEKKQKLFYTKGTENEKSIIESCNNVFQGLKEVYNDFNDNFLVRGDLDKFLDLAKDKSYLNISEHKIQ